MAIGPSPWRTYLGVTLSLLLVAPPFHQDDGKKEAAMTVIQALMKDKNWKDAVKKLKSYKRKYAKTGEEEAKVDLMIDRAKTSQQLAKIRAEYQKKARPRKASEALRKLIRKHGDLEDLTAEAKTLLEAIRSVYVYEIEDFEDLEEEKDPKVKKRRFMFPVTDPKFVQHGEQSCRWTSVFGGSTAHGFQVEEQDWSKYDFFCMWIYNERKAGKRPIHMRLEATSGGGHSYSYWQAIDWVGWREIRIPLLGRKSRFGKIGNPTWKSIGYLSMYFDDMPGHQFDMIIDDIRLEKAVK
ncbi:MAG: hypothetical protein O7H41_11125 [Planctomycetota bacterium]|nr:hypothetical protein [Planctomycetota bacterium]